jgi:effector-binding domain-containing protein
MVANNIFLKKVIPYFLLILCVTACNSKDKKVTTGADSLKIVRAKVVPIEPPKKNGPKAPIINIVDTVAAKKIVLYMKDSASTPQRISQKLAEIYGSKIPAFIKKNKIKINGAPIAWYHSQKAPIFFEAGIPIDKKPAKLPKGFFVKNIGGDSAVVAHFFGPYNMTYEAYEALSDYIKEKNKKKTGLPYEIYVVDPFDKNGKTIDPFRVQTNIVQAYE